MFTRRIQSAVVLLSILSNMSWIATSNADEPAQRRVLLSEDFEGKGLLQYWTSNGTYKLNFAGPSDEKAASGKRSFKIDITFEKDCSYNYWQVPVPLMVPCYGQPEVTGKLLVEHGTARLGFAWADPGDRVIGATSGMLTPGFKVRSLPSGWSEWSSSSAGRPESGRYINTVVVFVDPDTEGHTVVYVDDLKVEAALPEDYEAKLKTQIEQIAAERKSAVGKIVQTLRTRFHALEQQLDAFPAELPKSVSPAIAECWHQRQEYSRETRSELKAKLAQLQTAADSSVADSAWPLLRSLEKVQASAASFLRDAKTHSALPWPVWIVEPISDDKIFSDKFPLTDRLGTQLRVLACVGEYEPASFAVHAPKDKEIKDLLAEPSPAKCGELTIPASAIDIRVVKCWWQAGENVASGHPEFTPELLLKDAGLVRVDNAKKQNRYRDPATPRDAQQLVPLSVPAGSTQQFWVTVRVPQDAQPGIYKGTVELRATDVPPVGLPLEIEVLPFALEESRLVHSLYYVGRLTGDGKGSLTSGGKSPAQYLAEMRNMKAHGVDHPVCPEVLGEMLDRTIELRKEAGIANDPFYSLGLGGMGATDTPAEVAALNESIRAGVAQVAKHGIKQLYVYGWDEVSGGVLTKERKPIQVVHEAGAKVFQAGGSDAVDLVGDLMDAFVCDRLMPSQAEKWHACGKKIFSYANPQVGMVLPDLYRRNYGVALWKAGYDGVMDWAYQHQFGEIREEDDISGVRMYAFAYPTVDGVIDTIQWEGFREGVDDVRYLTTLLKAIDEARTDPAKKELAAEAEQWVRAIDVQDHLGALRKQMVQRIVPLIK